MQGKQGTAVDAGGEGQSKNSRAFLWSGASRLLSLCTADDIARHLWVESSPPGSLSGPSLGSF